MIVHWHDELSETLLDCIDHNIGIVGEAFFQTLLPLFGDLGQYQTFKAVGDIRWLRIYHDNR